MSRFDPRTHLPYLAGGIVAGWMRPKILRSMQTGTLTISVVATTGTATITAVTTTNSVLFWLGQSENNATTLIVDMAYIELTNTTTITGTVTGQPTADVTVGFCVVEFYPGILKSVQRGLITIAGGAATNTATITAVDSAKALIIGGGSVNPAGTNTNASANGRIALTNSTTVTATRAGTTNTCAVPYQVVEFSG